MDISQSLPTSGNNLPELLTRKQAAEFLHVNLSTLWLWTNAKKFPAYGLGNRVFYKKSEIIASLRPLN